MEIFQYGCAEMDYLRKKDRALGELIEKYGHIERQVQPDLFEALMNAIVGQQISSKAQAAIWGRMKAGLGLITPERIAGYPAEELKAFGVSLRKADYMREAALSITSGRLDLESLRSKTNEEVSGELVKLKGVGVWTAQMLMIFSMQRPDVLSYGDLAIQRGLRLLYRHRAITPALYQKYKKRYSPYGTIAGFYLWALASGGTKAPGVMRRSICPIDDRSV